METNIDNQEVIFEGRLENFVCTLATCPITLTTEIIGGRWKPMIIFMIANQIQRFGQMQRTLPAISKKMLTQELRDLERNGIIHREIFPEIPPRVEYSLTEWGKAALPILQTMAEWGGKYRSGGLPNGH
ncbi:MAG: helix-turn-helix transcriptional regulator [Microscillaceae bacterium]|nr:helix-turn-helix transcriptional regulator [Microscillaceae bacterium]